MKRYRGGLVFKAHKLVCTSTRGSRVIKREERVLTLSTAGHTVFHFTIEGVERMLWRVRQKAPGPLNYRTEGSRVANTKKRRIPPPSSCRPPDHSRPWSSARGPPHPPPWQPQSAPTEPQRSSRSSAHSSNPPRCSPRPKPRSTPRCPPPAATSPPQPRSAPAQLCQPRFMGLTGSGTTGIAAAQERIKRDHGSALPRRDTGALCRDELFGVHRLG